MELRRDPVQNISKSHICICCFNTRRCRLCLNLVLCVNIVDNLLSLYSMYITRMRVYVIGFMSLNSGVCSETEHGYEG